MTAPWLWPRALPGTIHLSYWLQAMGKRILCPLMPVNQGPPCPCSLALQAPGMAYMHYASCFNTDSHASPWKPASADTALGTVTPAVPQQQPQCALCVPETQDARSWRCAFLQIPVSGPWAGKPSEGQKTGTRTQASHQCRSRRQRERLDFSSRPVSVPGVQAPKVQGRMACPGGYPGTIAALCACLLRETPGCELQPGTTAAGTMVTVPLNLHSADLTSLPICHYPVFCTYQAARA